MPLARSKLTAQGQISVPAQIRKKLGLAPGSVLEWDEEDEKIVVRRSGQFSFDDIHNAVFRRNTPKARTLEELREGIRRRARERYARH